MISLSVCLLAQNLHIPKLKFHFLKIIYYVFLWTFSLAYLSWISTATSSTWLSSSPYFIYKLASISRYLEMGVYFTRPKKKLILVYTIDHLSCMIVVSQWEWSIRDSRCIMRSSEQEQFCNSTTQIIVYSSMPALFVHKNARYCEFIIFTSSRSSTRFSTERILFLPSILL